MMVKKNNNNNDNNNNDRNKILSSILITLMFSVSVSKAINDDDEVEKIDHSCPELARVELIVINNNGNGRKLINDAGLEFDDNLTWIENGVFKGCMCDVKPCISVCPSAINKTDDAHVADVEDDQAKGYAMPKIYHNNVSILENKSEGAINYEEQFHLLALNPCENKTAYYLEPEIYEGDEHYLLLNGSLYLPRRDDFGKRFLDHSKYCFKLRGNNSVYTPRVCSSKVNNDNANVDEYYKVKYIGVVIAVPFLISTIIVYSILPELKNIYGTTLRCYLLSLLVTNISLAADRISPPYDDAGTFCLFLGFTIYFSFLASFFWLNVMCVDMWWRLGGFGSLQNSGRQSDGKKFAGYSMYAWGSPVLLTSICIGMQFGAILPQDSNFRPGFELNPCWFDSKPAAALYFFGPVAVTIAFNIYFFISTSLKIIKHKKDTQDHLNTADSRRHSDNKHWFGLQLKLFIVMGISWSTEVMSWLWKSPTYLWYVTDMVNALQGFLIFVIFVCKRNILQSLKKRCKELNVTRSGCNFIPASSIESPATSASLDDSVIKCNVSVFALEEFTKDDENKERK